MASGDLITRIYSNFRGVDFRGEDVNILRSPDSLNMWKDYKKIESIRTRPKLKLFKSTDAPVYGIYPTNEDSRCMVHIGDRVKAINLTDNEWNSTINAAIDVILDLTYKLTGKTPIGAGRSNSVYFQNGFILKTQGQMYKYGNDFKEYVPTTSIGRGPSSGGTIFQDVNMLSDYRINTFCGNSKENEFYLDTRNIDEDFEPIVMIRYHNREKFYLYNKKAEDVTLDIDFHNKSNFDFDVDGDCVVEFDYEKGKVIFELAMASPLTDGQDNIWVLFKKAVTGARDKIYNCTMIEAFDNRVFYSGNPDYPNMIWHSALENALYVSDLDYYADGSETSAIKTLIAGNNALWVIKEGSTDNTNIFYHTPTIDAEYGKIYPSTHSSIAIGCVGSGINFNDDIVFFSERGMEGVTGDVTTEQVVSHRSTLVDKKLLNEENYKDMILVEWEGYLLVFIGNKVYLADSRGTFTNENHYEYEWFYWELDKDVLCASNVNGELWVGTEDGIYTLTDTESSVKSYWTTPKDKFNYPHYMKTTNKRGCVAEGTGDYSVYVKTNKTNGFEWINNYYNVSDYTVSRIKRKKFKDIQLKFASDTRFSLESVTLECFIGGYIKR